MKKEKATIRRAALTTGHTVHVPRGPQAFGSPEFWGVVSKSLFDIAKIKPKIKYVCGIINYTNIITSLLDWASPRLLPWLVFE